MAAPLTPKAGKPKRPKINIILSVIFTTRPIAVVITASFIFPIERSVIVIEKL